MLYIYFTRGQKELECTIPLYDLQWFEFLKDFHRFLVDSQIEHEFWMPVTPTDPYYCAPEFVTFSNFVNQCECDSVGLIIWNILSSESENCG